MELTLNDLKELLCNGDGKANGGLCDGSIKIIVLQRGWAVVGCAYQTGSYVTIKHASVIRVWGTTHGLGEIAENGPTEKTKLDACGDVSVHEFGIVFAMNCNQSNWSKTCR